MLALLAPAFALAPAVGAGSRSPVDRQPAGSPPEPFLASTAPAGGLMPAAVLAAPIAAQISTFFSGEPIPEGFPVMKRRTLGERAITLLTNFVGLVAPSTRSVTRKSVEPPPPPPAYPNIKYDFDGDGTADIGRWQATATQFKVKETDSGSFLNYTLGSSSAVAAPGDFDGNGTTDAGTFAAGTWKYKTSTGGSEQTISWGQSGDIPVAGNYDSNAVTDAAVFRPSNSTWYILKSGGGNTTTQYGSAGDIPIPGDYDGDGLTDLAVFRPSNGYWYVQKSGGGSISQQWGQSGDVPLQGDFNGDGLSDPAVFRPSTGYWYTANSPSYSTYQQIQWGNWSDQPSPLDYDGDGKSDFVIWRETTGGWHIMLNDGESYFTATLGAPGDVAVPSAYTKQVGGTVSGYEMAGVRLDPDNATGGTNLYSRNFSWGTSLVGLPGRSGMDLSLGIGYNSLVWAKHDSVMYFDPDTSNVTPGFRLGFPVIEPIYYDTAKSKWAYMMVTPNGSRIEFRETTVGNTYETADSSYTQLVTSGNTNPNDPVEDISITVKTTDGTQAAYSWIAGAYRCTQIKDRNGNYITISNDSTLGRLNSVTDTLGRVVTVNYNGDGLPTTIQQTWKGTNGSGSNTTHTWATLSYTTKTVATNFGSLGVYGPPNDVNVNVLQKITYADGSYTKFFHNGYLQVEKIENYAYDDHELNQVRTSLDEVSGSQSDCPRFTWTKTQAENFNSGGEITVNNTAPASDTFIAHGGSESTVSVRVYMNSGVHPDNLYSLTHFASSGYREGLTIGTEDCLGTDSDCATRKRWTWNEWTQDNTGLSYITNPRVIQSKVGDGTNTKKTTIDYRYDSGTSSYLYGLPELVKVYDTDLSTVLKTQKTVYNLSSDYTSRRIIGLPSESYLYQGTDTAGTLMSKVTYAYDEGSDASLSGTTQHDGTNYGTGFNYRGNLTKTKRWDTSNPTNDAYAVDSEVTYNIAGSPVSQTDPRGRVTTISYTDNFNSSGNPTTHAYPTTVTDPGNNSSTIKYRYDFGANVEANSPTPAGANDGKNSLRVFSDTTGRIERETIDNTDAYKRYSYANTGNELTTYSTIVDVGTSGVGSEDEVATVTQFDGAGRVRRTRTENPNSTGGWTASVTEYDILGRVYRTSVPTEVSVSGETWAAAGDDSAGWKWNYKYYDWNNRVVRTVPSDSNGSDGKDTLIDYAGCGCAGGLVTTIKGPAVTGYNAAGSLETTAKRRMQKVYEDILGRTNKTEVWDFYENGPSTPYSTTKTTFNGRDQATLIREYSGSDTSGTYQDTTFSYDGHGRLYQKHLPQYRDGSTLKYEERTYNEDDTVATVTDPRGAVATYSYGELDGHGTEDRALPTKIVYAHSGNSYIPGNVTFTYDAAGNRSQMSDGTGTMTYQYDELSRLVSEKKDFANKPENQPEGGYELTYNYHLAGGIKSIEDPFDNVTTYAADKTGRPTAVGDGSSSTAYASGIAYRAFGGIKAMSLSTGEPINISLTYDSGQRLTRYVGGPFDAEYSYYNDGMVSAVDNQADGKFDQVNKYDFAGRMKVNDIGNSTDGYPFKQVLGYDAFSNLTGRSTFTWQFSERYFNATYTNNVKTSGGSTDARDYAGNVTDSQTANIHDTYWDFDAAGRNARWEEHVSYGDNTWKAGETKYDGDGRAVVVTDLTRIRVQGQWYDWEGQNSYNIYSSVTGQKVTELTATGEQAQTFVYMGGTKIARFDSHGVAFHVTDPMTGSEQQTGDGSFDPESEHRIELAALGTNVPVTDPPSMPQPNPSHGGYVGSPENGCIFVEASNSPIPCSDFDFPIREKLKKPKKKEALGMVLTRSKSSLPFAGSRKGPDMSLAASRASGDEPEPDPDCGTQDCVVTVKDENPFEGWIAPPPLKSKVLQRAIDLARQMLKIKECNDAVSSAVMDARSVAATLDANRGASATVDEQPNSDGGGYLAYTHFPSLTVSFYSGFYTDANSDVDDENGKPTLTSKNLVNDLDRRQAWVVLHELSHVTGKYIRHDHPLTEPNSTVNRRIYDACLKQKVKGAEGRSQ